VKRSLVYGHFSEIIDFVCNGSLGLIVSTNLYGIVKAHLIPSAEYVGSYNMRNMLKKDEYIQYVDVHHNGIILIATS